jgi:hypothetical protein
MLRLTEHRTSGLGSDLLKFLGYATRWDIRRRLFRGCQLEPLEERRLLATVSMFSATAIEGSFPAEFTVFLSGDTDQTVSVDYRTVDGTAKSGSDYAVQSGTITFPAHDRSFRPITVPILDDNIYEDRETFSIQLSNVRNATIDPLLVYSPAQGSIVDNDLLPTLSIGDITRNEGASGTTDFTFTVKKTGQTSLPATVQWATVDGTATRADNDYRANSDTLTFAPGETSKTVTVQVNGDTKYEPDETFYVDLSGVSNATIARGRGMGTIVNDDGPQPPQLSINDVSLKEGDSGASPFSFTVTLLPASKLTVTVRYATADGTATTADNDYSTTSGTLTFAPGETSKTVTVQANGDTKYEPDEAFYVDLSGASNATIARSRGTGTIVNDDILRTRDLLVTGAGPGGGPEVRVYDAALGVEKFRFLAYDGRFSGGVLVAIGDVNGDGVPDIVTGAGAGGGPAVRAFDGRNGAMLYSFYAYDVNFRGGVSVAVGDVNGDGRADIVTGAGSGGGPAVRAFDGRNLNMLRDFYAYDVNFRGGVSVAVGDVNGDGRADIVAGAGSGGGPAVRAFDGRNGAMLYSFYAYDVNFRGGVSVAVGDVNGDGRADIVTGAGSGGGPHVRVFDGRSRTLLDGFYAYDVNFHGGVSVAVCDVNGDGYFDIITGAGGGGGPDVSVYDGRTHSLLRRSWAYDVGFRGGVLVAGGH